MDKQRALIIIKPDAVKRGLIGRILSRFETVGLKVIGLKLVWASRGQLMEHYPASEKWFQKVGERTLDNYAKKNLDAVKILGTDKPVEIGKLIKEWLVEYLQESPLFAVVLEGYEAVHITRKLCGDTNPLYAAPGTIRGDLTHDNIELANKMGRPIRNIIHATDEVEEASREIDIWFSENEIFDYPRADEEIMLGKV